MKKNNIKFSKIFIIEDNFNRKRWLCQWRKKFMLAVTKYIYFFLLFVVAYEICFVIVDVVAFICVFEYIKLNNKYN